MDARDVIVAPRITEKAMADALGQQYTFVVHPHATKTQIRHAVEDIFTSVSYKSTPSTCAASRATPRAEEFGLAQDERLQESDRNHQGRSEDRARRSELF